MNRRAAMRRRAAAHVVLVIVLAAGAAPALAGSLEPPGAPAPTMKTIEELAPRVTVQSLPFASPRVYVISQPGSYYLDDNIFGGPGITAISIEASDVVLDLNGFGLFGTEDSDSGINVMGGRSGVTIRNGTISGWPVHGIFGPNCVGCVLSDLVVEDNGARVSGAAAIWLGAQGVVRDVIATGTANGAGIEVDHNGVIERCIAARNAVGFRLTGDTGIVLDSVAVQNGVGIHLEASSRASRCVANENDVGINILAGGGALGCQVRENRVGIEVLETGADVSDNLVTLSGEAGILLAASSARARVAGNHVVCSGGAAGVADEGSGGHFIVANSFTSCSPSLLLSGANAVGELVVVTTAGPLSSANPLANLEF